MKAFRLLSALLFLALYPALAQTYTKEVSRIIQAKCQQCHRPNDIAPFALMNFDDASSYAADIKRVVSERKMPPWKPAVEGSAPFRDDFSLNEEDRLTLLSWVEAGAPKGDDADLPEPAPVSESPWELGEPDLILSMPEYTPPRVADTYRCFVLPTGLDETRFISAAQALPGDKRQVHHVLIYIDQTGESAKLDGVDGQPGYTCFGGPLIELTIGGLLGGWAPGARTRHLPEGIGQVLPGKSRIVMQVHYHPGGRTAPDQTRIGLWYRAADKVEKRLVNIPLINERFVLPPGESNIEVKASQFIFPFVSGKAIQVAPHMHLLGRKIRVEVRDADGTVRPMINIEDWDFNWQGFYTFTEPVKLPANSTVWLTSYYDNSANNPRNPNNPLKAVRWGEGTEDEMCLAFVGVVFDNESLLPFRSGSTR